MESTRIFVVEDNQADFFFIKETIGPAYSSEITIEGASDLKTALKRLKESNFDLVLLDLGLPDSTGLNSLQVLHAQLPSLPVIVLTGLEDEQTGIMSIRMGAQDYLIKGSIDTQLLVRSIRHSIERKKVEESLKSSTERYRILFEKMTQGVIYYDSFARIISANPAAQEIAGRRIEQLVDSPLDNPGWIRIDENGSEFPLSKHPVNIALREGKTVENVVMGIFNYYESAFRWVSMSAVPIFTDGQPKPCQVFVTLEDITARKRSEEDLRLSEEKFRTLFESSPLGISICIKDIIILANNAYASMFGFESPGELFNTSLLERLTPEFRDYVGEIVKKSNSEKSKSSYDLEGVRKDGTYFPIHIDVDYFMLPEGEASVALISDRTEIYNREEKIKASLKEKEVLLKEIHHRVKNNLQIITSLLSLQSDYIEDEKARYLFDDSKNRIRTMAMIHEMLYQSSNLSEISFSEYTRSLISYFFKTYNTDHQSVSFDMNIESISLTLEMAIPCGLIINELISNSLKHAFIDSSDGKISISFSHRDGFYNLIVSDNGKGFPLSVDFKDPNSLGLILVDSLVKQLKGNIELDSSSGAKFTIIFPA